MPAWLTDMCLYSHPFSPTEDPPRGFDFQGTGVSLRSKLPLFSHPQLVPYYVRVGPFAREADNAENALVASRFPTPGQSAPALLIQGEKAVGRKSFAEYLAYLVKTKWCEHHPNQTPDCQWLDIEGENIGVLMYMIKLLMKDHATNYNIVAAHRAFSLMADDGGVNEPNETVLRNLFGRLAQPMQSAPPLILIIHEITYLRRDWVSRLTARLTAMNVIPIFITDQPLVYASSNVPGSGVAALKIQPMTSVEGTSFIENRMRTFRAQACTHHHTPDVFPFDPNTIATAFSKKSTLGVRLLVEVMSRAFDALIRELDQKLQSNAAYTPGPQDILVRWRHVDEGYRKSLAPNV